MRQPFYVFPRKMSKGIRFYIQFSNPNRSGRSVTVSATTLKEQLGYSTFHPVKSKYEAFSIGKEAFEKGIFFNQQAEVLFADYVMNFWDFDNSDYIKRRNKEKPNSITKAYANQERNRFLTYAITYAMIALERSANIMSAISVTNARDHIYQLLNDVNESNTPITITNARGKNGVLIGEDDWNAIQETLYLNSIPGMTESLLAGKEVSPDDCVPEEEVTW